MTGNKGLQSAAAIAFARRQIRLSPDYLRIPLSALARPFLHVRFVSSQWAVALAFRWARLPVVGWVFQVASGVFTLFLLRKIELQFGAGALEEDNDLR
jgi:hypothetical protein